MTYLYDIPYCKDASVIRCPSCGARAEYRVAFSFTNEKQLMSWWSPRLWQCARVTDWHAEEEWKVGDPEPGWKGWRIIQHDPAVHRWDPSRARAGYRRTASGIVSCAQCVGRRPHDLRWPEDAYYRFELPEGALWARDRDEVIAIIDYIASDERDAMAHGRGASTFLIHLPTGFLRAKVRDRVVRRLRRELRRLDG